jgi:phospholipid/cholesterol/gamma-HCH transport system substrate-binding protein
MARPRLLALGALALAAVALVLILGGGGTHYVVTAQFRDASQLVKGGLVEVSGRKVGLVSDIALTDEGLAAVTLDITEEEVIPLHEGTRAAVRSIGLSGVANRFVNLEPGPPTTAEIPDGGVLGLQSTRALVDLDAVLNAVDPDVRRDIRGIVRDAASALDPRTARQANAGLELLNPALSRLTELGSQLNADQAALASLLRHTSSLSGVLARHRASLGQSLVAGAGVFTALAAERDTMARLIGAAPESMRAITATLQRVRTRTLPALDPLMVAARPAIGPLADVLREAGPVLENARPLLRQMRALIPRARAALEPIPGLRGAAVPAIAAISQGLTDALPMVSGLRPYTPEIVAGFFSGFGGNSAHSYDANGHYARVFLNGSPGSFNGLIPNPPGNAVGGYRTRLDARCPGAAEEPHPDGSNPWAEGAGDACDPEHNR